MKKISNPFYSYDKQNSNKAVVNAMKLSSCDNDNDNFDFDFESDLDNNSNDRKSNSLDKLFNNSCSLNCNPTPNCNNNNCQANPGRWPFYWQYKGTGTNPSLVIQNVSTLLDGTVTTNWSATLPTPVTTFTPDKRLFSFDIVANCSDLNFEIVFENLPPEGIPSTIITVTPTSTITPLTLDQYILIRNPGAENQPPQSSNLVATISRYSTKWQLFDQLTLQEIPSGSVDNLMFTNQLFFFHMNATERDNALFSLIHTALMGEKLARVDIKSQGQIRIIDTTIEVLSNGVSTGTSIIKSTGFVNGQYLFTYATYTRDSIAITFGNVPQNTTDARQRVLQLAAMIVFNNYNVPVIDLALINPETITNEHQIHLLNLYQNILLEI